MKTFLTIILFTTTIICKVNGQSTNQNNPFGAVSNAQSVREEFGIALKNGIQNAYTFSSRYEGVKGSPFLYDNWQNGSVCLQNDSTVVKKDEIKYKFDSFNNELWILNKKDSMICYSKDINWFIIEKANSSMQFSKYAIKPTESEKFYHQILSNKKVTLIKDMKKQLQKADFIDKGMSSTGKPYDRFEEEHTYYLKSNNNNFSKVKMTGSSIIDKLPDEIKGSLKSYAKKNNLWGKIDEADAIKILNFAESELNK